VLVVNDNQMLAKTQRREAKRATRAVGNASKLPPHLRRLSMKYIRRRQTKAVSQAKSQQTAA